MPSDAALQAAEFTGKLWAAIGTAGGTRPARLEYAHFARVFDPGWLARVPLPVAENRPPGQPVALLDDRDEFERHTSNQDVWKAYSRLPRTLVYEAINREVQDDWYSLAARHLGRLARCELQVVCSVFQSTCGDNSLGAHFDTWYGAIVQMKGAKTWRLGKSLLEAGGEPASEVTTRAGDVLLIPKGLPHEVITPSEPGYSTHLTFAIDRDNMPVPAGISPGPRPETRM